MTWKLFTFSLFILTICQKIPFFLLLVLWTPKIQNLYISMRMDGGIMLPLHFSDVQSALFRCAISLFQISTSASLSFCSCFYSDLRLRLWWGGWILAKSPWILPWFCFWRWLQYFPAENTKFSGQENTCFQPRKFYIPYENQQYSCRKSSAFW